MAEQLSRPPISASIDCTQCSALVCTDRLRSGRKQTPARSAADPLAGPTNSTKQIHNKPTASKRLRSLLDTLSCCTATLEVPVIDQGNCFEMDTLHFVVFSMFGPFGFEP